MKTLFFIFFAFCVSHCVLGQDENGGTFRYRLADSSFIRVEVCTNSIFHIQISKTGKFSPSLMERYDIVKTDWKAIDAQVKKEKGDQIIQMPDYKIILDSKSGIISVKDNKGNSVIDRIGIFQAPSKVASDLGQSLNGYFGKDKKGGGIIGDSNYTGNKVEFTEVGNLDQSSVLDISLKPEERFYGGGSSTRATIQHRGAALRMWATYQRTEAPIPFLMSTNGWGIFNNTTSKNYFDIGRFNKDKMLVYNTSGEVDFYLMFGKSMVDVLNLYTTITGKPYLLPKYAYGLTFGSNTMENQFNVLDNAVRFRTEKIPCDIYWLEPQWMSKYYDVSTKKAWNEDKFQASYFWCNDPKDPKAPNLYVKRMLDLGFKTALWLNVDHDLSIEEEDKLAEKSGKPQSGQEHWFPHLHKFIDQGVAGFKLDPGRTLDEHPDRKYYNGKTDAEMHNLQQTLLQKQMYTTFREHTGLRSFHHYCGGYAGVQHWGAATVGDNGGGVITLFDILNHSYSGNSNMSIDVLENTPNKTPAIHYSFLIPWINLNSWAWLLHPWYYNQHDKEMFRFYDQLRYSLIPYIYSAAINSSLTGQPIVWPMGLAYPNDRKLDDCRNQYMFGENLLVGAFTDSVYLPEGIWIDYWTGKKFQGKQSLKCTIPEDRGGPLFIKAGAIIPYQKPMQYIGEHLVDTLIVRVFPEGKSSYTLLEDDGVSFDYEKGNIAKTRFACDANGSQIEFSIEATKGTYNGMPKTRVYELEISMASKPQQVLLNNQSISNWNYETDGKLKIVFKNKSTKEAKLVIK